MKPRKQAKLFYLLVLFIGHAQAEEVTLQFSTKTYVEDSNAVVNTQLGYIHPTLFIKDWDLDNLAPPLPADRDFDVGDGSDGAFNSSTYARFHSGTYTGCNPIIIDTDLHPVLNFTQFTLDAGCVLRPTGSQPLKIRSLSTVVIKGVIDCSGDNGEDVRPGAATAAQGGNGRCGGGKGGNGGTSSSLIGQNGTESGPRTQAVGVGGSDDGAGGGGGAGYTQLVDPVAADYDGEDFGTGTGGTGGDEVEDDEFTHEGAGAGGGGGAAFITDARYVSSGAGGGGGGGFISIEAVGSITVVDNGGGLKGEIRADGGAGGSSPVATCNSLDTLNLGCRGGAGGAGGGGSILLFSGGTITFDGPVTADGYITYPTKATSPGGDGGVGHRGRTWIAGQAGWSTGSTVEEPTTSLFDPGVARYDIDTAYVITSTLIDLQNTAPKLSSVTADADLPSGSTLTLQIAGSDEPFDIASAQWMNVSTLGTLQKRYIRLRLLLNNQDETNPAKIRSVSIRYENTNKEKFEFVSSCGSFAHPTSSGLSILMTLLFLPPLLAWRLRSPLKTKF